MLQGITPLVGSRDLMGRQKRRRRGELHAGNVPLQRVIGQALLFRVGSVATDDRAGPGSYRPKMKRDAGRQYQADPQHRERAAIRVVGLAG